jgi:hypothetical protein
VKTLPAMSQTTLPADERQRETSLTRLSRAALERCLARLVGEPVLIQSLQDLDGGASGAAALKAFGYGRPICITYQAGGAARRMVMRQVRRNGYGRERDSDRVAEVWLDFHTFNRLARHARARDMLGLTGNGELVSLADVQDVLLLTEYAPGQPYADDLIRIRGNGAYTPVDLGRARCLASYLAGIHELKHNDPLLWRRRLRDLVGHGEGIMGLTDGYPSDFRLASAHDLCAIENAANAWRWRLKPLTHRLSQVHGDFHPFNVLFTQHKAFSVLDRSRGEWGEPADDVSCMSINYLFFSLQRAGGLEEPFLSLHNAFWNTYLAKRSDDELCTVIQPWYAWRALVLASPQWYPSLPDQARRLLLTFARRVMEEEQFQWHSLNRYLSD